MLAAAASMFLSAWSCMTYKFVHQTRAGPARGVARGQRPFHGMWLATQQSQKVKGSWLVSIMDGWSLWTRTRAQNHDKEIQNEQKKWCKMNIKGSKNDHKEMKMTTKESQKHTKRPQGEAECLQRDVRRPQIDTNRLQSNTKWVGLLLAVGYLAWILFYICCLFRNHLLM